MMSDIPMKHGEEKQKRFEEIYKKYSPLLIKSLYDMTSDFNLAEEMCQHVFMMYFIHMDKIVSGMRQNLAAADSEALGDRLLQKGKHKKRETAPGCERRKAVRGRF